MPAAKNSSYKEGKSIERILHDYNEVVVKTIKALESRSIETITKMTPKTLASDFLSEPFGFWGVKVTDIEISFRKPIVYYSDLELREEFTMIQQLSELKASGRLPDMDVHLRLEDLDFTYLLEMYYSLDELGNAKLDEINVDSVASAKINSQNSDFQRTIQSHVTFTKYILEFGIDRIIKELTEKIFGK